jgi:hypothetical protein
MSKLKLIPAPPRLLAVVLSLAAAAAAQAAGFTGKVIETTNASSYTYVQVDTGTNKLWAAANRFPVKVGDVVTVPDSEPMLNFHSPTLNRSFPMIYFAGSIQVAGAPSQTASLPAGHPPITAGPANPAATQSAAQSKSPTADRIDFTGIKPAAGGKTVEQIYADGAKLAGQSVKVRGKVVKYNGDIMGRNWLHIQDGTGGPASNDLLVTSAATVKVGDTVLVEGKVALNRDFGSGYKYSLLLEEAKVTVE